MVCNSSYSRTLLDGGQYLGLLGWVAERASHQEEGEHLLRLFSSFGLLTGAGHIGIS